MPTVGARALIRDDHLVAGLDETYELERVTRPSTGPAALEVAVAVEKRTGGAENVKSGLSSCSTAPRSADAKPS